MSACSLNINAYEAKSYVNSGGSLDLEKYDSISDDAALRKLVVWKTNKETVNSVFPAYVVHWSDYGAGRATPLDKEVRLAPSENEAMKIAEGMITDNIKKGWVKVQ